MSNRENNKTELERGRGKIGLDEFLIFDEIKGEIRMEIPLDILFDPEKSKKLREPL